ncbi:Transcription elongation factor B polypeptide 3 [Portunus trituberculatus]|uniref:Transcription elongation factor B polypeptide 3 n=1 Tax=Portunus trituberculatus TaxID=210409 RepID=A0A5B7GSG9_PORTR|nr:Transcription elongation factor B polypeptide 3 [Portunus trituberculatus]
MIIDKEISQHEHSSFPVKEQLALEYTGGIPFEILRPVLERASAKQLLNLEDFNHYLLEDSDVLWKMHCKRDFKKMVSIECEMHIFVLLVLTLSWKMLGIECRRQVLGVACMYCILGNVGY